MIHTYFVKLTDNDYFLNGLITKSENRKEALVKLNNRYPLLKLKEYDLLKLNKIEIIPFYQ